MQETAVCVQCDSMCVNSSVCQVKFNGTLSYYFTLVSNIGAFVTKVS